MTTDATVHELVAQPELFGRAWEGAAVLALRARSTPYAPGDRLLLRERDPERDAWAGDLTGRWLRAEITAVETPEGTSFALVSLGPIRLAGTDDRTGIQGTEV